VALTIQSGGEGVHIVNRVRPFPFRIIFHTLLLIVWCGLGLRAANDLRTERASSLGHYASLILCGFLAVSASGLVVFTVWMLVGSEAALVTHSFIRLRKELGPLRWTRVFEVAGIGTIHVTPPAQQAWHSDRHDVIGFGPAKQGEIEFDHDAALYRFGFDLRWAERVAALQAIAAVLPQQTIVPTSRPRRPALFRWWAAHRG